MQFLFLHTNPTLNSDLVWLLFRFLLGFWVRIILKFIVGEVIEVIIEPILTGSGRAWQLANGSQLKGDFLLWNVNFNEMECSTHRVSHFREANANAAHFLSLILIFQTPNSWTDPKQWT